MQYLVHNKYRGGGGFTSGAIWCQRLKIAKLNLGTNCQMFASSSEKNKDMFIYSFQNADVFSGIHFFWCHSFTAKYLEINKDEWF